jgi:dihydrodipicolinate reductase
VERLIERSTLFQQKYKQVQEKICNDLVLLTDDIEIVLKHHHHHDDSPLRKTAKEIREQWEKRKEREINEVKVKNFRFSNTKQ